MTWKSGLDHEQLMLQQKLYLSQKPQRTVANRLSSRFYWVSFHYDSEAYIHTCVSYSRIHGTSQKSTSCGANYGKETDNQNCKTTAQGYNERDGPILPGSYSWAYSSCHLTSQILYESHQQALTISIGDTIPLWLHGVYHGLTRFSVSLSHWA